MKSSINLSLFLITGLVAAAPVPQLLSLTLGGDSLACLELLGDCSDDIVEGGLLPISGLLPVGGHETSVAPDGAGAEKSNVASGTVGGSSGLAQIAGVDKDASAVRVAAPDEDAGSVPSATPSLTVGGRNAALLPGGGNALDGLGLPLGLGASATPVAAPSVGGDSPINLGIGNHNLLPSGNSLLSMGNNLLPSDDNLLPSGDNLLSGGNSLLPSGNSLLPSGDGLLFLRKRALTGAGDNPVASVTVGGDSARGGALGGVGNQLGFHGGISGGVQGGAS